MVIRKPSIFIYMGENGAGDNDLRELCAGMEEEGVFYEVFRVPESDAERILSGYRAAESEGKENLSGHRAAESEAKENLSGYRAAESEAKDIVSGHRMSGSAESNMAQALAWKAAQDSMMGTGIGVWKERFVLTMKGLPKGRYVQAVCHPSGEQCRVLGANAARSIKRMPFKDS